LAYHGDTGRAAVGWRGSGPRGRTVLLVAAAVLCAGCGGRTALAPIDPAEFRDGPLADLQARFALTETIRSQMTITVEEQGASTEARAVLYYRRPDSLRLDVLDPLSAPVVVMRAGGGEFSLVDLRHSEGIRGPLTDAVLRRLYGMDLRVSDVRSAIVANPFAVGDISRLDAGARDGKTVVFRASERIGHREEIVIGVIDGEPVVEDWWVRDQDGDTAQHTSFSAYRDIGGILRPMRATVERPADGVKLSFHAINPQMNLDIADSSFLHLFPHNIDVKRWDEHGRPVDAPRAGED
jgi:hypothetical protein